MFIWGGVSSVIWSEISFYGDALVEPYNFSSVIWLEILFYGAASAEPQNLISDHITDDIPPQMNILNMVIPILMHFLTFIRQIYSILHQTEASSATKNNYVNQSQAMSLTTLVLRRYIAEYTDTNSRRYPIRRRVTFASALKCSLITLDKHIIADKHHIAIALLADWFMNAW